MQGFQGNDNFTSYSRVSHAITLKLFFFSESYQLGTFSVVQLFGTPCSELIGLNGRTEPSVTDFTRKLNQNVKFDQSKLESEESGNSKQRLLKVNSTQVTLPVIL